MECTIAALIACFSWSGVYLDSGLSFQDIGTPYQEWRTHVNHTPSGAIETVTQLETLDDPFNPYGWVALGYQLDFRTWTIELSGRYGNASLDEDSPGKAIKSLNLGVRWYPFRR